MVGRKKCIVRFRFLPVAINRQSNRWLYWRKGLLELLLIRRQNLKKAQLIGCDIILKQTVQNNYQFLFPILGVVSFDSYQLVILGVRMIVQPALNNSTENNKEI